MNVKELCILNAVFMCCLILVVAPAASQASSDVPGDLNGDKIVSSQELQVAEQNYKDGNLSSEDLANIKHIHDNYPRSIIDSSGRNVTIYKPIERIAVLTTEDYEILRTLKATDKVVAASKYVVQSNETGSGSLYSDGSKFANVGSPISALDYEALIKSNPDLVITYLTSPPPGELEKICNNTGATLVRFDSGNISQYIDIVKKEGYLLEKEIEAESYITFYNENLGKYLQAVKALSKDKRPKVYLEADYGGGQTYYTGGTGDSNNALIVAAGANNLFSNVTGFKQVDPESVAMSNPEVILIYKYLKNAPGIDKALNDMAALKNVRDGMLNRTELRGVQAVKNNKVYIYTWDCTKGGAKFYLGLGYIGKWLVPSIFKDYNPRAVYQEYLKRFQGVDIDVINKGVFVYPEV